MSLLEVLQLIGYSLGALLPLWMGYLLFKQRLGAVPIQRLLLGLGACMIGWHAGNLVVTLRSLIGVDHGRWDIPLRLANTIAVISITVCYSLLLHVHIHLWASSQARPLTKTERIRTYLSYIPCLFLVFVLPKLWTGPYQPMILKLSEFVLPFAGWVVYSLVVVAATELMVARNSPGGNEGRILRTLAGSFLVIALLIAAALGLGLGKGTIPGQYLQTFANLGSLLPSALLAYYIYRYRYLELIIKESLVVATFAAVVLAVYLYGIRWTGDWVHARWGVRAGVVEAILILALTLIAAPLRGWLERSFRALFQRETALYRDVVSRINSQSGRFHDESALVAFLESQILNGLPLRRVKIVLGDHAILRSDGEAEKGELTYSLQREGQHLGLLTVEGQPNALTPDVRAVLDVLAGQVAIAIEDCRLLEENVRLERKVAEGERLAALGQMAATVAHEVKNPLSAIKSIAQVMAEDEGLTAQHARDLSLIAGETDRLSKSVTQLLSFAAKQPPAAAPSSAGELLANISDLFRADADDRKIVLRHQIKEDRQMDGVQTAAISASLSNLISNALQVTPSGGEVLLESTVRDGSLIFSVADTGPGVPPDVRAKIWEPFFTTRQRGTGLGLSIVRKRMEEAGGAAILVPSSNGSGAKFELHLPLINSCL